MRGHSLPSTSSSDEEASASSSFQTHSSVPSGTSYTSTRAAASLFSEASTLGTLHGGGTATAQPTALSTPVGAAAALDGQSARPHAQPSPQQDVLAAPVSSLRIDFTDTPAPEAAVVRGAADGPDGAAGQSRPRHLPSTRASSPGSASVRGAAAPTSPLTASAPATSRPTEPQRRRPAALPPPPDSTTSTATTATALLQAPDPSPSTPPQLRPAVQTSPRPGSARAARGSESASRRRTQLDSSGSGNGADRDGAEEVAQLARSLRSEIAGQPFLLTPAFGQASRPSSSYSDFSGGSRGEGGGSGHRRRRSSLPRLSAGGSSGRHTAEPDEGTSDAGLGAPAAAAAGMPMSGRRASATNGGPTTVALVSLLHSPSSNVTSPTEVRPARSTGSRTTPPQLHASLNTSQRSPCSTHESFARPPLSPPVLPSEFPRRAPLSPAAAARMLLPAARRCSSEDGVPDGATSEPPPPPPPPMPMPSAGRTRLTASATEVNRSGPAPPPQSPAVPAHGAVSTGAPSVKVAVPAGAEASFDDGLDDVAELRRRLLTEDFFSSPFRKLRRDGRFPWKLTTSVLLCLLLLVQVVWYQLPLAQANGAMRLAITEHFMGETGYYSKAQGDIVAAPTEWMEGLYTAVEHYVSVYYNLSNTSSSDMNYYFHDPTNVTGLCRLDVQHNTVGGGGVVGGGARHWWSWRRWRDAALSRGLTSSSTRLDAAAATEPASAAAGSQRAYVSSGPCTEAVNTSSQVLLDSLQAMPPLYIPVAAIEPVLMRVEVDVYSRREGAQHVRLTRFPLATAAPVRWLGRQGIDAESRDAAAEGQLIALEGDTESSARRLLTFYVDADHPLGPFAKYKAAARGLRRASRQERRHLAKQRKRAAKGHPVSTPTEKFNDGDDERVLEIGDTAAAGDAATEVDAALAVVCAPRYDELSGRFYRPCASARTAAATLLGGKTATGARAAAGSATAAAAPPGPAATAADGPTRFVPEFSLMENVRRIQLVVTLRHEADNTHGGGRAVTVKRVEGQPIRDVLTPAVAQRVASLAARTSAVFQWVVEKDIAIHPGGLVETQLRVHTRMWPMGTSRSFWTPHFMAVLLSVLALLELVLRARALQRIAQYRQRLRRERIAFIARQAPQPLQQQGDVPHEGEAEAARGAGVPAPAPVGLVEEGEGDDSDSEDGFTSGAGAALDPPFVLRTTAPYEWGFPGSPAYSHPARRGRHVPPPPPPQHPIHEAPTAGVQEASVAAAVYTHASPPLAPASTATAARPDYGAVGLLPAPLIHPPPPLVPDTSFSVIAGTRDFTAGHPAAGEGGAQRRDGERGRVRVRGSRAVRDAGVPPAAPSEATPLLRPASPGGGRAEGGGGVWRGRSSGRTEGAGSHGADECVSGGAHGRLWLPGLVRHWLLPGRTGVTPLGTPRALQSVPLTPAGHPRSPALQPGDATAAAAAAGAVTPQSMLASRASFPNPGHPPLTAQLTERIMERTYVDVRTTWRHHLQQTMGTGWHWVAIAAAAATLAYAALLLGPLLPHIEVAQTGAYDAWTSVLLGVAALLSCVLLLSYLRFFPSFYFPILASIHVVPKLVMFAVCVSPLFLGFAVFFVVAFGAHSNGHYDTLGWASLGLYFVTYGDSLLDTVNVLADTPDGATAFFANVMALVFVLVFMMIMLNMAMTITQHEWLRLRRRFGAALSTSSLLFAVRSRAEVKREAVEAVRVNLEVLWFMLAEDEAEEAQRRLHAEVAAGSSATATHSSSSRGGSSHSGSGGHGGDSGGVWLSPPAMSPDASYSAATWGPEEEGGGDGGVHGGGQHGTTTHHRSHHHEHPHQHPRRRGRPHRAQPPPPSTEEAADRFPLSGVYGGGTGSPNADSSYEVSAATTVPADYG